MSERDVGKALLGLDATDLAGLPDTRRLTWQVLERDRRRVRRLTIVTLLVWLLAFGLVMIVLVAAGLVFPAYAKIVQDDQAGKVPAEQSAHARVQIQQAFGMLTVGVGWSVVLLAIAALCTVFLVTASRRATLRQINASLIEISEQLRQLRPPPG